MFRAHLRELNAHRLREARKVRTDPHSWAGAANDEFWGAPR